MPRDAQTVSIDGVEGNFTIIQLPAERAYYLLLDILAIVAPDMAKMAQSAGSGGGMDAIKKMDVGALGEAFRGLFAKGNRDEVKRITTELFSTVEFQGGGKRLMLVANGKSNISEVFDGAPTAIFLLQKEALRVNYSAFFHVISERLARVGAKVGLAPETLPTSGGPSGASSPSTSSPSTDSTS